MCKHRKGAVKKPETILGIYILVKTVKQTSDKSLGNLLAVLLMFYLD